MTAFQPAWQAAPNRTAAKTNASIRRGIASPSFRSSSTRSLCYAPLEGLFRMFTAPRLIVIALCAALNFSIGTIVHPAKLPVTSTWSGPSCARCCLRATVAPDRGRLARGNAEPRFSALLINPFIPYFAMTDVALVRVSVLLASRGAQVFRVVHPIHGLSSASWSCLASSPKPSPRWCRLPWLPTSSVA